jgi:KaiC/GvpD/RAD55 family RecA-like ATPase
VQIRQLLTGVRGLDEIIGGGLPEFSFNLNKSQMKYTTVLQCIAKRLKRT